MRLLPHFNFQRLQWKLTLYYILITIIVLLLLEVVGFLVSLALVNYYTNRTLELQVATQAQVIASNFNGPFVNQNKLEKALDDWPFEVGVEFQGFSMVINSEGQMIASSGGKAQQKIDIQSELPEKVQKDIQTALSLSPSEARKLKTYHYTRDDILYIVAPLANEKDVRGTLVLKAKDIHFSYVNFWRTTFQFFGLSILAFLLGAAFVGIAFGIFTSRSLVRRIRRILSSTDRWSEGDFTTFVDDPSKDELGQLSRRLNQMAKQLRNLFRIRQDLATLEERNRLARELHDSVKQQLFATSIWLNTSKTLIGKDEKTSKDHLMKAENLLRQTQRELSALIRELRPVVLEGKDLTDALKDYVDMWQEQTGIHVDFKTIGKQQVSPIIEEVFFRITQEALHNVARHSQASRVTIHLICEEIVTLFIQDNGCGFDINSHNHQGVGLSSMRERIHILKGQIEIQSMPGEGVKITVQCNQKEIPTDSKVGIRSYLDEVKQNGDDRTNFDFNSG
ncbi:HAMP domain-containing sensor histidine kinase [Neobacillus massiliamazoniensis]|uniref:histidine kinase n=1 Tax=Neobacillus massiliamazoniensis TaxID=1499688 RepID=A0A0U1NYV8_9BACI|nr:sensor histidine kinase [Neobacillus massiliamazoniensis]CRK83214.1 integral membrane sensor signal transduction histidine kinase [Neobacillus massiliamazoniensis]